jgi:hypothetical protein
LAPVALLLLLSFAAPSSPSAELARGKTAFQRAEYARAIEVLRPLLYPEVRLASEGEMVQTHRMLGVAHLFQRQNELAAEEFRKLLQLRPDFRMDALIDPPMVVDFFNQVLEQHAAELAELENKRREAEANAVKRRRGDEPCPEPTVIERRTIRHSRVVSFLPFGAGQFQNGQRTKGWGFFSAQAALGAISLGAMTTNFALYGVRPTLRCEPAADPNVREGNCAPGFSPSPDRDRSQMLLRVQLVSGALFFATAIWGVTDAILNFEPEVVVDRPAGENPAVAPRTLGKTSRNNLMLAPTLMFAEGVGGTLAFRF